MTIQLILSNAAIIALAFHVSLKWGWYEKLNYALQSRWGVSICVLCTSFWMGVSTQIFTIIATKAPLVPYEILVAGAFASILTLASFK